MDEIMRYVNRIIKDSTPSRPLWNLERLRSGNANGWNYIDGCMLRALIALSDITGDGAYFDFARDYISHYVSLDGAMLGYRMEDMNLDNICEGVVLFDVYDKTGDERCLRAIETLRGQLRSQPRTHEGSFWHKLIYPDQVWLDGLYMAQVFYTRYTTRYEDCAAYGDILGQFKTVRERLYDEKTGLYRHGYDASRKAFWADESGKSANPWLRSLGWFAAALVDTAEQAKPEHNEFVGYIGMLARELAGNILLYIDADSGMLWQVPDRIGESGNYPETSGSAMIAYFLLKGARLGILDEAYGKRGSDIFDGICRRCLTARDGQLNLGGICLVAGLGPEDNRRRDGSYGYYISEPVVENDAKGLAPFLLCYVELLRVRAR